MRTASMQSARANLVDGFAAGRVLSLPAYTQTVELWPDRLGAATVRLSIYKRAQGIVKSIHLSALTTQICPHVAHFPPW
jgi:hypothetical protein